MNKEKIQEDQISEHKRRVVLFEDETTLCKLLELHLSGSGFLVINQAQALDEALALIPTLASGSKQPLIAIVDANLKKGTTTCEDGIQIAVELLKQVAGVKIVGYSSVWNQNFVKLCSAFIPKGPLSEKKIV